MKNNDDGLAQVNVRLPREMKRFGEPRAVDSISGFGEEMFHYYKLTGSYGLHESRFDSLTVTFTNGVVKEWMRVR